VIAVNGWQPRLAKVSMSAWMPAPDDGSLAAKIKTCGGLGGEVVLEFMSVRALGGGEGDQ
jgi:hypothetical protein